MSSVMVVKLGGSVLTCASAYRQAAGFVGTLAAATDARVVAVVSAERGHTDKLFDEARHFIATPDPDALALLWSTGELRSVALLTFAMHAAGVRPTDRHARSRRIGLFRRAAGRRGRGEAVRPHQGC